MPVLLPELCSTRQWTAYSSQSLLKSRNSHPWQSRSYNTLLGRAASRLESPHAAIGNARLLLNPYTKLNLCSDDVDVVRTGPSESALRTAKTVHEPIRPAAILMDI